MCGICGYIKFDGNIVSQKNLQMMMTKMKHRGPDDEGMYVSENVGLGHVRLSIIDLSDAGHQPFFSDNMRYVIIYNGEIYNYIEIREELTTKGYRFRTRTDTEVILNAYIEWGEECLEKFNGMWAFTILDINTRILFGARDRYGVKPFYYMLSGDQFLFASDLPPILSQFDETPTHDKQVIFDYLTFNRTDHSENTFFESIKKLQHGHKFTLNTSTGELRIKRWYDLRDRLKDPFNNADEFLEAFQKAIQLRLRSDVPLGVCLSGGLDSSSIVSLLADNLNCQDINTFSAVYDLNHRANEKVYIDMVGIKNKNFIYPTADTFIMDISRLLLAQSEPFPTTAIYAQFKVMELAKKSVTVLLDGQGADECLGGYHYFYGNFFYDLLKRNRIFNLTKELFRYYKNYSFGIGLQYFGYLNTPLIIKKGIIRRRVPWIAKEVFDKYIRTSSIINDFRIPQGLNESCINHFEYKLEHLLKWEDRNSMYFSLESRVPFLDFNLVERLIGGPPSQKIKIGFTKYILRESMKGKIPEQIRLRKDKIGFATPEDVWLKSTELDRLYLHAINSDDLVNEFCKTKIKSLSDHQDAWKWINLHLWGKQFLS